MIKYGGKLTNENEAIENKKYYIFYIGVCDGNVGVLFAIGKHYGEGGRTTSSSIKNGKD